MRKIPDLRSNERLVIPVSMKHSSPLFDIGFVIPAHAGTHTATDFK